VEQVIDDCRRSDALTAATAAARAVAEYSN